MRSGAAASPASTSPCAPLGGDADPDGLRREALADVESDARRLGLVTGSEQRGAFGRRLQRFGDHDGDRLVGVAHAVVLQQRRAGT